MDKMKQKIILLQFTLKLYVMVREDMGQLCVL